MKEGEEVSKGQPQNHFPLVNPYTSDPDLESGPELQTTQFQNCEAFL